MTLSTEADLSFYDYRHQTFTASLIGKQVTKYCKIPTLNIKYIDKSSVYQF